MLAIKNRQFAWFGSPGRDDWRQTGEHWRTLDHFQVSELQINWLNWLISSLGQIQPEHQLQSVRRMPRSSSGMSIEIY